MLYFQPVVVGEMFLTLFLLLSLASHRGFQFSTTENEIPDDRSIVTINKFSITNLNLPLI